MNAHAQQILALRRNPMASAVELKNLWLFLYISIKRSFWKHWIIQLHSLSLHQVSTSISLFHFPCEEQVGWLLRSYSVPCWLCLQQICEGSLVLWWYLFSILLEVHSPSNCVRWVADLPFHWFLFNYQAEHHWLQVFQSLSLYNPALMAHTCHARHSFSAAKPPPDTQTSPKKRVSCTIAQVQSLPLLNCLWSSLLLFPPWEGLASDSSMQRCSWGSICVGLRFWFGSRRVLPLGPWP